MIIVHIQFLFVAEKICLLPQLVLQAVLTHFCVS